MSQGLLDRGASLSLGICTMPCPACRSDPLCLDRPVGPTRPLRPPRLGRPA